MHTNLSLSHGRSRRSFLQISAGAMAAVTFMGMTSRTRAANVSTTQRVSIRSYASDPKDVDSVNSHWIETSDGIIVIDAQRLLPEAERVVTLIERTNKPISGIFITHPHTDHYGGLSVLKAAAPNAPIYAAEITIQSMRDDTRGFNEARKRLHGDRFPSQDVISANLPTNVVSNGDTLTLGGLSLEIFETGPSESETATLIYVPDHSVIFPGDIVTNYSIPAPFESLENWLVQLDTIESQIPGDTIAYHGHGLPADLTSLIVAQREYLVTLRDLVRDGLDGGSEISDAAVQRIIFELSTRFPFHTPAGGLNREQMLSAVIGWVARQQVSGDSGGANFFEN